MVKTTTKTPAKTPAKAAAKKAPAPKKEAIPEPAVEETATEEVSSQQLMSDKFTALLGRLQSVNSLMTALRTDFRSLEKDVSRELRAANKASAKRKRKAGNRAPSGFVKPTLISTELASFLGKPHGTEMARTDVTREINHYIKEHKLQDASNGRKINPDKKLNALLNVKKGEELTYFNLQRYMSPHFAKAGSTVNA
tara:strand:- start:1726 stop:2313 length:588 start_codon:yes stop_codon:yes gene_type:complete